MSIFRWFRWTLAGALVLATAAVALNAARLVLDVQILSPSNGATVSGTIAVTGSSQDIGSGRVSVSIDGRPFELATGVNPWSYTLDTTTLSDGSHTITARARQSVGSPPALDSIDVTVANGVPGVSVTITSPANGAVVLDTFTVVGQTANASSVTLSVDGGPFQSVNGLNPWDAIFEPGSLTPGPHTLTARAVNGPDQAFDMISITVDDPPPGVQEITYASSVDGEPLDAKLWIPTGFNPNDPPVPLVVHLHGGGGLGSINATMAAELDARGWIGLSPDGRRWGLVNSGCTWQTSAAYVDNPDPDVGPGEQDILDAIDWARANFPIDENRIYLTGFSMGGRGSYIIGLKNPDLFAAIGPMAPAIDMYEIFVRRPNPPECKEGMVGGQPGDSLFVDTMYTITSGRFLIENAYNLPVFHGHGQQDRVANNDPTHAPFLHGWHITDDTSFTACHAAPEFCFGHTPTLSELNALHPQGYDWAFMFTPVAHSNDPKWAQGTPVSPVDFGTEDPLNPGQLIGMYDFFGRRSRQLNPEVVVYKSYTDTHTKAYWVEIDVSRPWENVPGAIRASRGTNAIHAELVRVDRVQFDLGAAGLRLRAGRPFDLILEPLNEPVFDPALQAPGEPLRPQLVLRGDFAALDGVVATIDGRPIPPGRIELSVDELRLGPIPIDKLRQLQLTGFETDVQYR